MEGATHLEELLREAVRQTGYHGQNVSLLLAHPRLVQQLLEVPPIKGQALRRIIFRQAQQQKIFTGEAAWASQTSLNGRVDQRLVLHLFPKVLLKQYTDACHANDLYLTAVIPPSAVLHQQSRVLPLERTDVALLAAETAGSTTVVIGRGDGQLLLARTLAGTWNEDADRLAVDLNRTIQFVNQQYSVTVNKGVWIFGEGAVERLPQLQQHIQLPVRLSPTPATPNYWATEAPKLRPELTPNFVTPELQKAYQREVFAKIVATVTVFLVLGLSALSVYGVLQARQEAANIRLLAGQFERLQRSFAQLQARNHLLAHKERVANLVLEGQTPPVPVWFLGYLSEAVPPELVITNLQVKRQEKEWRVQLAGTMQPSVVQPSPEALSNAVGVFANRLAEGPFHVRFIDEKEKSIAQRMKTSGLSSIIPEWVANLESGTPARPSNYFEIEGVMQ
jgi:hypothetical protein